MIDRERVVRLRGVLYQLVFEAKKASGDGHLQNAVDQAAEVLALTADGLDTPRPEWRRGYVWTGCRQERLEVGQVWAYQPDSKDPRLTFEVVAMGPDGDVQLRPTDGVSDLIREHYPERPWVKGEPDPFPFKRVDDEMARRGAKEGLRTGDLLCHQAWTLWEGMMFQRVL
jgi:hypothetical protein